MPSHRSHALLQACKLSAFLLLCLLFLPSLFFSLVFLFLFGFVLFLPIISILTSTFLLSAIINRIPALSLSTTLSKVSTATLGSSRGRGDSGDDQSLGDAPDYIVFDQSEVPSLNESDDDEDKAHVNFENYGEGISEDWCQFQDRNPI